MQVKKVNTKIESVEILIVSAEYNITAIFVNTVRAISKSKHSVPFYVYTKACADVTPCEPDFNGA